MTAPSGLASMGLERIESILGDEKALLSHQCKTIDRAQLQLPGPDFVDRVWTQSDRSPQVLLNPSGVYDPSILTE